MFLFYIVVCALFISINSLSQSKFPNFNYMGAGYDAMKGNPNSYKGIDPGFVNNIFVFDYNTNNSNTCCNDSYIIPNGFNARESFSCSTDFAFNTHTSISDYEEQLSETSFIAEGEYEELFAFRASYSYEKVAKSFSKSSSSYGATSTVSCSVYDAFINSFDVPQFTTNFISAVELLPLIYNNEAVCNGANNPFSLFIEEFGTHLPTEMEYGCKYGSDTTITSENYASFESSNYIISDASGYFAVWSGGSAFSMTQDQVEQAQAYSSVISSNTTFNIGSEIGLLDLDEWSKNCKLNPYPVIIENSIPITNLLSEYYLPLIANISDKATSLINAINNYCKCLFNSSQVASCSVSPPSPSVAQPSIFGGIYTVDYYGGSYNNGQSNKNNSYTNDQSCNHGYLPYTVWSSNSIVSNTDTSKCMITYICLNKTIINNSNVKNKIDPMGLFGGGYQLNYIDNPMTTQQSCSDGYNQQILENVIPCGVKGKPAGNINAICFNNTQSLDHTFFGGVFSDSPANILNYYTKAQNCPPGFNQYDSATFMYVDSQNHHKYANLYVCLNNVYT